MKYSYDLYNKLGRIKGGEIRQKDYEQVINSNEFKLLKEWSTEFKDHTLYARRYDMGDGYELFIWKEVYK